MKKKNLIAILAGLVLALLIVVPILLSGGGSGANSLEENLQRYKESVKFVLHLDANGRSSGSGTAFVINGEGNLVTNAHVVCPKNPDGSLAEHSETDLIYLVYEKQRRNRKVVVLQRVRVLKCDRSRDLALLQVTDMADRAEFKPLAFASTNREGQSVTALGYPASYDSDRNFQKFLTRLLTKIATENKLDRMLNREEVDWDVDMANWLNCVSTDGTISHRPSNTGLHTGTAREAALDIVIHTATLQGGMSGGPLINAQGRVVGVNYAGYEDKEMNNRAIDAGEVLKFIAPRDGSLEDIAIVDKDPDSFIYTLRTKLNNAEPHEVVITVLCSVVIIGAAVTVLMVLLKDKNRRPRRQMIKTTPKSKTQNPTPGDNKPTTRFEEDAGHTIPMGRAPSLLFTGIDPNGKALRFRIPFKELESKRTLLVGRSEGCAIRFDREYKEVSRQHASIMYEQDAEGNGYLYIRDEQATNPTLVNGTPLREKCLLMDGDELTFASVTLTFKLD